MSLVPDFRFEKITDVSVEFLKTNGVKGVILDIDNTLEPYENPLPSEKVLLWFQSLRDNGIAFSVVSNNNYGRVNTFLTGIDIPAYAKAFKPSSKKLIAAIRDMGTDKSSTVFIGDQIFTDVWAAHNAGIKAILLPPIKDKRDPLTKFKRLLERPFLRIYEKKKREDK